MSEQRIILIAVDGSDQAEYAYKCEYVLVKQFLSLLNVEF